MRSIRQDYDEHAEFLFRLCYRMTGVAADAEDLVQETFTRFLTNAPEVSHDPPRPWLTTVATRLSLDHLRKRKRRGYTGPWLPSPIVLDAVSSEASAEQRYSDAESLSYAFLTTLETMLPTQRAVFILRDALGYSVRETADTLGISEANVKTTLHRARAKMDASGDETGKSPVTSRKEAVQTALTSLLAAVASGDPRSVEELLAKNVRSSSDGGGEFHAALRVVSRRDRVARQLLGLAKKRPITAAELVSCNGFLSVVTLHGDAPHPEQAPRAFLTCDVDETGLISRVFIVLASKKLASIDRAPNELRLIG